MGQIERATEGRHAAWGYLAEALLAMLVFLLLLATAGTASLVGFIEENLGKLLVFIGLVVAIEGTFLKIIFGYIAGDFAKWLRWKKSDTYFLWCGSFTLLVSVLAWFALLAAEYSKLSFARSLALFLVIYTLVALINLVRATIELHGLKTDFEIELERAKRETHDARA